MILYVQIFVVDPVVKFFVSFLYFFLSFWDIFVADVEVIWGFVFCC